MRETLHYPDGTPYASRVPAPLPFTIWDNGGATFDRYTVIFPEGDALGIGDTGNVPNGFCMHVGEVEPGPHLGEQITLAGMTEPARRAVISEWNTYYAPEHGPRI